MKNTIKKIVSMLLTIGICSSFAFTVQADSDYDHIGFDYMQSAYSKGDTEYLEVTAYDADNDEVTFEEDLTYSSSNENVVTIDENGLMTMVNYGVATVTATYGSLSASMLITVSNNTIKNVEGGAGAVGAGNHSTDLVRKGEYSYKLQGGTNTSFSDGTYSKINSILHQGGSIPANAVIEAWFYDNGNTTDSEAGVYMSPYSNNSKGARAVGILTASDTTYKVSTSGARLSKTNNNWNQGNNYGMRSDEFGGTDTGIARTVGWHQVTYVRKNANSSQTIADGGLGNVPQSTVYYIYLDGHQVYSETANRSFVYLYGYAGYNSSNYAYIADPSIHTYVGIEGVNLTELSGTFTISSTCYGITDAQNSYKWQVSDDGETDWADISGATGSTYTPSLDCQNKYIRGGVKVTASGIDMNYSFSEATHVFVFDGQYDSVSLSRNTSYYSKGVTGNLNLIGYRYGHEFEISDLSDVAFTSSNENVVTVTNAGILTAVDYGVATVTATYGSLSASMLVTVTNNTIKNVEGGAGLSSHSVELKRNGEYSYKLQGGTNTSFSDGTYSKINSILHQGGSIPANAVIEAWFYDNGNTTDSEAGVYMSPYSNSAKGARAVGVLTASDTTYKVSTNGARLSKTNNNWNQANNYGMRSDEFGGTDTGIARTVGWHQVTYVRKNANSSQTIADGGLGNVPQSTVYYIYLDGHQVYSETANRSFVYLYGYAGYNSSNYAYIADPSIHTYVGIEGVNLTELSGTFTISSTCYGITDAQNCYKWQVSDDGETDWADISGATGSTYTPSFDCQNKYIRGGVKVTASGIETNYSFSEATHIFFFDGEYDSISLGGNISSYSKGGTGNLNLIGYRYGHEFPISDLSDAAFTSSNENVVTVTNAGVLTAVDYGVATVTATYGGLSASMLVTVTNNTIKNAEGGAGLESAGNHSTDLVRTGSYSYKLQGGTDTFSDGQYAKINSLLHQGTSIPANAVIDVWFYDNGNTTDSEAGVYMSPCSNEANGAKAVGILNASDSTYKVTKKGARLTKTGENWNNGNYYGVSADVMGTPTDTGIARTKGWHQVTYVRKNTNASQTIKDNHDSWDAPKSTVYYIYLDGQQVYTETADRSFVYLYGYAGYNSSNYAYIADPKVHQYIGIEDVAVSEEGSTLTLNSNYYGATEKTVSYKWQVSDDGVTGWTDISGATNASYTPAQNIKGKYVRGGVSVDAGEASIALTYSDPYWVFDGVYRSISLANSDSYFVKGTDTESQLILTGYVADGSERTIDSFSNTEFSSNNTNVVSVDSNGLMTINDYGVATVTAKSGELQASMLVTVTNNTIKNVEGGAGLESAGNHSTDLVRKGEYSYKLQGGTDTSFSDGTYSKINSILHQGGSIPANAVIEAWFYDNGNTTDSEAGVYMSPYSNNAKGARAVGILTASDTTYRVSTNGARLSKTNNNWNQANNYGMRSDEFGGTDTGIARTKGWHQVTYVRKNANSSQTIADGGLGNVPKSTVYDIYLDGQQVYTETADRSFVYLYGYAGYNSSNYAYIADAKVHQYVGVENVALTESNGTFTIDNSYYGTTGAQTKLYKWQISDNGITGWTNISGATNVSYTPASEAQGKYIRACVSVTDTLNDKSIQTEEHFTDARYVDNQTSLTYSNGYVYITSSGDIENAVLIIAEYKTVGSFIKLVTSRTINVTNITANVQKAVSTGTIAPASGNNIKIMLWNNMETQKSLCGVTTP